MGRKLGVVRGRQEPGEIDYAGWIRRRVEERTPEYRARPDRSLFSIITPIYDTPPKFLRAMAHSVFAQDFHFQWVVCDNGSTDARTLAVIDEIRDDPRVAFVRVAKNEGIMAGTRAAFDVAAGRYVLPVDSDDLLYPDALRVMASWLERCGWPKLAYSDEDKVFADATPHHPFFKPSWDPALFLNCCYIAHLCAIDRAMAADLGAYTDYDARGCHDWDTFTRFLEAGHVPVHVPEVLYSWRIHAGSSSSPADNAKPYTVVSQEHVLNRHLSKRVRPERFELRTNPLFGHDGMWHVARRRLAPAPLHVFAFGEDEAERVREETQYPSLTVTALELSRNEFRPAIAKLDDAALVAFVSTGLKLVRSDWAWEALGVLELHPSAVACVPRILDAAGNVESAGEYFGFNGVSGAPDAGIAATDSGYHGWAFCQRCVGAVTSDLFVCRASFLRPALEAIGGNMSHAILGAWLGAVAAECGGLIVYSPHFLAQRISGTRSTPSGGKVTAFLRRHHDLMQREHRYSRFFQLRGTRGYRLATPAERAAELAPLLASAGASVDASRYAPAVVPESPTSPTPASRRLAPSPPPATTRP